MAIVVGADLKGTRLKDVVKNFLVEEGFEVIDVTKDGQDFVDVTLAVSSEVNKDEQNLGIVIDAYGAGPFMVATKIKGMVAAEVSDERSAYMTRGHNNARMITVGAEIVGDELAKNIAKGFVNGKYDGGRHQIRVDMLNKMC
ncbi:MULTISPECIES: galactose-6-phosphate isomerase subunit LacA [Enterococcus]|jgi:galactose-6-phosphate isomerase|uniref:Galactose-6-phosphate isomerase subunit LacA n=2 Tax=Enterococcus TaxID=1350 RepID=E6LIU7_ENTI1|nr:MULTISPECIES: galactose-6-phosphate isomerase subunit LacA [Enterococcus]EAD2200878.1 galactose-6-phosphate isomerase subunit LacA [Listeria monocytogenes]EAF6494759.1 galactose-6-phosphate isomerase subunit LacA [Listeria monocytogenes]EFU72875.1 galactose-6-phosphate isomerase, LacA subunit [Enterococcus italicus DSM 15952]EGO8741052.1 galactose-6-phosphate isomerase subunit LacA [Enterococcus faecalis]EOL27763.1 galactose-6-phosphate isomerase subunit lacA [Enterococcus faecalis EnGen036